MFCVFLNFIVGLNCSANATRCSRLACDQNQKLVSDRIASLVDAEREAETRIDERFAELMANLEKGDKTLSRIEEAMNLVSSTM